MEPTPLYVYGIARADAGPLSLRGLDDEPLRTVADGDIAAFVSDAPPGAVETTRGRLLTHARVLEYLASDRTVLPMRFGVVAPSERALREGVLSPRRKVFASLLDRLEGTVEVDVRVLYEESAVVGEIVRGSPTVRRLQLSIRNRPADATYYDRIRLGEAVAAEMSALAARDAARIGAHLEALAVDVRTRPSSQERGVLNGAFLVRRSELDRFEAATAKLENEGRFQVRVTGPMPPYSFVDVEVRPARGRRRSWAS
jgi:hypothetical protein